jgi:cation diffusion facilitator family transporter
MTWEKSSSSQLAAGISFISNVLLTAIKLVVGFLFQSGVLIADGIHNAGDVIASAATYGSMRVSSKPADDDHPYGHGKAEVLGAGIVALILALAALYIGYHSIMALFEPAAEAHLLALVAAAVSLVWKLALYVYTMRIAREHNSRGLIATAYDHLADVYASVAAVLGIGLALIGDKTGVDFLKYGDPAAGIVVALLVLKLTFHMSKDTVDVLMEKNVDQEKMKQFALLIKSVPQVKRIDRLRARELGQYILLDVRVSIPAELSVQAGHDVCRDIQKAIKDVHANVDEVFVHVNPWYPRKEQR